MLTVITFLILFHNSTEIYVESFHIRSVVLLYSNSIENYKHPVQLQLSS